jgi:hypothetical protein
VNRKIIILVLILVAAGAVWWKKHHSAGAAAETPKPPEEEGIKITHDPSGRVVLHVPDEIQGNVGITVAKPDSAEFTPEIKAYGRVLDPAPLAAAVGELQAERIAADYSRQEFERMKVLKGQNNASERAFRTAEETYVRDEAALKLSLAKIRPVWGDKITERLSAFTKSEGQEADPFFSNLAESKSLLIRVDLPVDQTIDPGKIKAARIVPLAVKDTFIQASYFGMAPYVDAQTQGRGLFFVVSENTAHLLPGAALTAYIQLAEPPASGVRIPLEAVVRAEGSAWVYIMGSDSDSFTRTQISLDHPLPNGWFTATNITTTNYLVVTGAQSLLSQETKPAGGPD